MNDNTPDLDSLKSAWQDKYQAKKLLQTNKANANFQIQQGDRFIAQNQLLEAITCYRHALKIDPNSGLARKQLEQAIKSKKLPSDRVDSLPTAKKPSKNSLVVARIYLQQARAFTAEGEWHKAIAACQKALSFNSQLAEAYKIWGDSLQRLDSVIEAMEYYARALEIEPNYAEVCLNLGSLSFKQQQWQLSIDYYRQAAEIEPNCAKAYRNLARVYKKLGQQQLMFDCWYQALQIEPNKASVAEHCQLAKIMLQTGKVDRAIACYRAAIKLKPNLASLYLSLGELLIQQNDTQQAINLY
ncbi:MAG: tetratricopeptide repeat protein, partial [Cyanobacteria bacterium P01_G01_bin.19]